MERMSVITFDKLAYLETLKAAGIPEQQARAHTVALDDALKNLFIISTMLAVLLAFLRFRCSRTQTYAALRFS